MPTPGFPERPGLLPHRTDRRPHCWSPGWQEAFDGILPRCSLVQDTPSFVAGPQRLRGLDLRDCSRPVDHSRVPQDGGHPAHRLTTSTCLPFQATRRASGPAVFWRPVNVMEAPPGVESRAPGCLSAAEPLDRPVANRNAIARQHG